MAEGIKYIIESITPSHNSLITAETAFQIVFKEHMDGTTLTADTIPLIDSTGTTVPATYSWNGMKRTLTVTPVELLVPGTYNLSALTGTEGPKTATGDVSVTPYSYYFRLEETSTETPTDTTEEPVVDDTTEEPVTEEPVIEGLFLMDSYPSAGDVRSSGEPVVLIFSQDVAHTDLIDQVYINKRKLHPLLAGHATDDRLMLQPEKVHTGTTHTLLLPEELAEGTEAELVLTKTLMDGEHISISFQQNWDTLYADIKDVRLVLGMFGKIFTDAELMRLTHRESINTYQIMSTRDVFNEADWADGAAPYAATQYVVHKTAYQAILNQVIESGSGMRQSFNLGDFGISEAESTSSEIVSLIGLLKEEVDRWWKILNGKGEDELDGVETFVRGAGTATRGGATSSYPEFITRVPFQDLGG